MDSDLTSADSGRGVRLRLLPTAVDLPAPADTTGLRATTDREAIAAWLAQYRESTNTFDSYRREAERFWLWLQTKGLTLVQVKHEDMLQFLQFLRAPPEDWISRKPWPRSDPRWQPFHRPLGAASVRQAESILKALFGWLVEARYLPANPLALMRHKRSGKRKLVRFLTTEQLALVYATIEAMPTRLPEQRAIYARDRWLIRLLYLTAMRISEAATRTMGDVQPRKVGTVTKWALQVIGKGDKERSVPITHDLLVELATYRVALGLSGTPAPGEDTPLLNGVRGRQGMTRAGIYNAVKRIFATAADRASGADAEALRRASPHWLRHTRATHLVEAHVSLGSVREFMGHASLTTTSLYAHEELDRVQDEVERADAIGPTGTP